MTDSVETFQLSVEAAEVYESQFVPALFAEWAPHLVEAGGVAPGQAVLDVACGTGVVARTAADPTSSGAGATRPACRSSPGRSTSSSASRP